MLRLTVIAALVGCASPQYSAAPSSTLSTSSTSSTTSLDSTLSQLFALDLAPGMSVAVVRDTQVIYAKGFGWADVEAQRPVTPETIFYIASTTKSFTGLAAVLLDEQGRLDLDAPLSRYLPTAKLQSPLNPDSITLRSLLSHTHGIDNDGPIVFRTAYTGEHTNDRLLALLAAQPAAKTGREYVYGNVGYNVAALAMDATLGESWREVLQRLIFGPLGMTSTSAYISRMPRERLAQPYRREPTGFARTHYGKGDANMQAAGGLVSTAADMARWLEAHINAGVVDGRRIFSASAIAETHRRQATVRANARGLAVNGYGFGWQIGTVGADTVLTHGGGFLGFSTSMSFMPQRRIGVIVMTNENGTGSALAELAARAVYSQLINGQGFTADSLARIRAEAEGFRERVAADRARRAARPQTLPFPLEAYAGTYENDLYGRLVFSVVNGKLEARAGAAWSAVEVFDGAQNALRVELTGSGSVARFTFEGNRAIAVEVSGVRFRRID
ncbi:MAG TPA: serine hydrolase [Gemmatimonadaceae bacterium]|nr:serine hydrolase [Gemmatimonadaceae bacterium]